MDNETYAGDSFRIQYDVLEVKETQGKGYGYGRIAQMHALSENILVGVVVNDVVTREAITKDQMRKFLKFVHDDVVYCKYYEVIYILFHTGMRISELFRAIIEDRPDYKVEKVVDGYTGFIFLDKDGMPLVAMHWEHRFNHMVSRRNEIYKV